MEFLFEFVMGFLVGVSHTLLKQELHRRVWVAIP